MYVHGSSDEIQLEQPGERERELSLVSRKTAEDELVRPLTMVGHLESVASLLPPTAHIA